MPSPGDNRFAEALRAMARRRDDELVKQMDRVRELCSVGKALRESKGLRARLPLPKIKLVGHDVELLRPYVEHLKAELNVKEVEFVTVRRLGEPKVEVGDEVDEEGWTPASVPAP